MNNRSNNDKRDQESRAAFVAVCLRMGRNDATLVEITDWSMHNVCLEWQWTETDLMLLGKSLMGNTHLKSIHFPKNSCHNSCNHITPRAATVLCQGLAQSQLETVDCDVASWPVQFCIYAGVQASTTIQTLKLASCFVNASALAKLLHVVVVMPPSSSSSSSLTSSSQLMQHGGAGGGRLTKLCLGLCQVNDMDMLALSLGLTNNRTLTSLRLPNNIITSIGVMYFCQHWKDDSPLQLLDLNMNHVGATGASLLLQASAHHPAMNTLQLVCNGKMGPVGVQRMGEQLAQCRIVHLEICGCVGASLWDTKTSPESLQTARALANGIRGNTSLKVLNMGGNKIGAEGAKLVLQAVAVHPCLQILYLALDQSIGYQGLQTIGRLLPQVRLKELRLDLVVTKWPTANPEPTEARQAGQALLNGVRNNVHLEQFWFQQLHAKWLKPIQVLVDLNRTCRPLIHSDAISAAAAVWPHVLAHYHGVDKKSHVFFCLREQPWLCVREYRHQQT